MARTETKGKTMNHAQEARWRLDEAISAGNTGHLDRGELCAAIAQAHATLELAEQQRIANLIALARLGEHTILREQVSADAAVSLVEYKEHTMGGYFQLKPEIAAALGIGEQP